MTILTQEAMIGKRVKLLTGERVKIEGALKSSYKMADGSKLPARKLMQKGRGYVETELTVRDLEDTGLGYVVPKEEEGGKKGSAKKASSKKPSRSRATKSGEKPRRTRRSKAKAEAEDEKPTRGRRGARGKKAEQKKTPSRGTKQSAKSSAKPKAETKASTKVERQTLSFDTGTELKKIRQWAQADLQDMLTNNYDNIVSVACETVRNEDDLERGELRIQILIDRPLPEHHSKDYYLQLAQEAGANLKTPSSKVQVKLAERLEREDEDFEVTVGDVLIDDEGNQLVFAGLNAEIKRFILVDVVNEQIVEAGYSKFDELDYQDSFEAVLGAGLEDVANKPVASDDEDLGDDDSFDLDEEKPALADIKDWGSMPVGEMVDLIIGNYSRDEILEFVENHEDLDPEDEDLELETEELVRMFVELLADDGTDEDFVDDGDESEEDELDDDLSDEDADDVDTEEANAELDVDALRNKLIEEELLTPKMAAKKSDEDIIEIYVEEFGELPELEADDADDIEEDDVAEELTVEEMKAALLAEELLTPKMAGRMSDEDIIEMYEEEFADSDEDTAVEAEDDDGMEDVLDSGEAEDDVEEDEDDIEEDEDEVEEDDAVEAEEEFDDLED